MDCSSRAAAPLRWIPTATVIRPEKTENKPQHADCEISSPAWGWPDWGCLCRLAFRFSVGGYGLAARVLDVLAANPGIQLGALFFPNVRLIPAAH